MTSPTDTEHDRLRFAREARNLTQEALAERAGVHAMSVSKHENGAHVSPSTWRKYARALRCSEGWLRYGVGNGPTVSTTEIVHAYLQSEFGASTPPWVVPLLSRVSYKSLGVTYLTVEAVHRVRELIQFNRAVDPTIALDAADELPQPKPARPRR